MKKFFIASLTFMLLALSCFGLVACNNNMMKDKTISVSDGASLGENVTFTNSSDFKVTYKGDKLYKASGTASTMTAEQATAYGGGTEGDKYVVLEIETTEGSTLKYGFVTTENKDTALGEVNEPAVKQVTMDDDDLEMILRLNNSSNPYWRVEITKPNEAEHVAYLVDFTSFYSQGESNA